MRLRFAGCRARWRQQPHTLIQTFRAGVLLASYVGLPAPLVGQSDTTGAISGHIVDAQGLSLSAVDVTITAAQRGMEVHTRSSLSGDFLVPSLAPAEYTIDIQAPDKTPVHLVGVAVEVGRTAQLRVRVRMKTVGTRISVDAEETGDLEEGAAASSAVISSNEITNLPVNGRRWQDFALLTPEVNPGRASEATGLLSFRAIATPQNSSRLDGVEDDQSFSGTPHGSGTDGGPATEDEAESEGQSASNEGGKTYASGAGGGLRPGADFTFAQGAVREFRVVGQSYSALYGHSAGGIIATVSRRGTDSVHGSAFYLQRESAWAATNPFSIATRYTSGGVTSSIVKPTDHRLQFGGSIGGPIAPSHLRRSFFYFFAVEAQRRSFPAISSPENPAFYALTPTQRALLGTRGVMGSQIDKALTYLDSLTGLVPRRSDNTVSFLKLDGQLTARNQVSLQYNRARYSSPAGLRSAPVVNRAVRSFGSQEIKVDSVLGRWTFAQRLFSNELRLQYNRDRHAEQAQTPLAQEPSIAAGGLAPEIAIGPQGFYFGTPASVGKAASPDEHRFHVSTVSTSGRGRHLFQAGVDYSYVRDTTDAVGNALGTFHYDSGTTNGRAGGLVDWITDFTFNVNTIPNGGCSSIHASAHYFCFRSFSQSFGAQTESFSTQEFAGYLQERWRASERLSLTAGLRYEYELLPLPQHPNAGVDAFFSARGATGIFPEDRNNLGPRVSAAWQPRGEGKGTIRIAYGLYFGRLPGATIRAALADTGTTSSVSRTRITPTTITACPQVANQGFGYPCTFLSTPSAGVLATTSVTLFDRRFRTPMIQQGSLSFERDVPHFATLSVTYLLNLNHQLPGSVDLNIAPATTNRLFQLQGGTKVLGARTGDTFLIPVYTQRLTNSFGPVTTITSHANGTYNALVLEGRHRARNGLEFRASWTWSKSIDFGQSNSSVPRTNGQFDPYQIRYDKSLSSLNVPHKLVLSAIWEPRAASTSVALRHLSSGWLLAPILTESAGRPYSLNIFGGNQLTGGHESINGSGGEPYLPTVGRDTLRLPDSFTLSARVSRDLPITEKCHLYLSAESFNLTNHVNYTSTTQRAFLVGTAANGVTPLIFQDAAAIAAEGLNSRPFGTLTGSSGNADRERQLEFGARLEF